MPDRHPTQPNHYVLAGVAIPAMTWAAKARGLESLRAKYGMSGKEIHVAWLLRPYPEQLAIEGFADRAPAWRRSQVERARASKIKQLEAQGRTRLVGETRTFHRKTAAYVHLTLADRQALAAEVADLTASWPDAVLFAEVFDKTVHFDRRVDEEAYEQVASRFEAFLGRENALGVLAYDHNDAVARKLTGMTADFQATGGLWRQFHRLAGHPFFVASHLSDMIQIADVVGYGLRRYADRGEDDLLRRFLPRFDRIGTQLVGLRHYRGGRKCQCLICSEPRAPGALVRSKTEVDRGA